MDLRPLIYSLTAGDHEIRMKIATGSAANIKPDLVIRTYMEASGMELADFALLVRRDEVYANRGSEDKPDFCPLGDFGEDIK